MTPDDVLSALRSRAVRRTGATKAVYTSADAAREYVAGKSGTQIAREQGVDNKTVYYWLEQHGVRRRPVRGGSPVGEDGWRGRVERVVAHMVEHRVSLAKALRQSGVPGMRDGPHLRAWAHRLGIEVPPDPPRPAIVTRLTISNLIRG